MTRSIKLAFGIDTSPVRSLEILAYIVIIGWGITAASEIISVILFSLLLAYAYLPFPNWLMHRFQVRKSMAISITVVAMLLIYLILAVGLFEAGFRFRERLPLYEQHLSSLYAQLVAFLNSHGFQSSAFTSTNFYSSERVMNFVSTLLPKVIGLFSDRVLVSLLSLLFLVQIAESDERAMRPITRRLLYYGKDVQRYIAISAQTGVITALANLAVLIVLRVDFPILWCILYFFLHFIPNIGFIIAIVPPAALALLVFGWKRALLVIIALIVTQTASDYILQPVLMKKSLHISLLEVTVALMIWGFLLGPPGAVLGVPLTIALKKYLQELQAESEFAAP